MIVRRLFVVILLLFMSVGCEQCDNGDGNSDTSPDSGGDTLPDGGTDGGATCGMSTCAGDEVCFENGCFPACATSEDCASPELCFDGRCAVDACEGVTCASGEDCVKGSCSVPCTDPSECAAGESCFDNGYCADDPCSDIACPFGQICYEGSCYDPCGGDDDCTPPNVCYDGRCSIDACDGVFCPFGEVCAGGTCAPFCGTADSCQADADCATAGESCQNINSTTGFGHCLSCNGEVCFGSGCDSDTDCAAGEYCFKSDGALAGGCVVNGCDPGMTSGCAGEALVCQSDACDGVQCPSSQVCYEGSCYDPCTDSDDCTPPNLCNQGVCAEDLCAGVHCPFGEVCYEGSCYEPCGNDGDCTPPNVCYESRCAADPCDGVQCPFGQVCYEGSCFATCVDDGDCTPPNACYNELCSDDPCVGSSCPFGEVCYGGSCYSACSSDDDCTPPNQCYDGTCTTDPCVAYECPMGQTCACSAVDSGVPVSGTIGSVDETSVFRFTASEGDLITLRTESSQFDGNMILVGPSNAAPLETVTFTTTEDAWLPYRVPITGTYTVVVESSGGTGDFDITYISYGSESAMDPTLFEGQVTTGMPTDFYFFGRPDEIVVADLVIDPSANTTTATGSFEQLLPDESWSGALNAVGSEPLSETGYVGSPGVIAASGVAETIYRLRVVPGSVAGSGGGVIDVRMDKMAPKTTAGTIRVDSTGNCAGFEAGIPRLASLALAAGSTIEICDGTHVEYGTLYVGPGAAAGIQGTSAAAVLQFGTNNQFSQGSHASCIVIDSATSATIEQLSIEAVDPGGAPADRVVFDVGANPSTDTTIENVHVRVEDSASPVISGFGQQDGLRLIDFSASGQVNLGLIRGDDVEMRRVSIANAPGDSYDTIAIFGDRTVLADSTIGEPTQTVSGGIAFSGHDSTFTGNTVYTTFEIEFSVSSGRVAGAVVENNLVTRNSSSAGDVFRALQVDGFRFAANRVIDRNTHPGPVIRIDDTSGEILNNRIESDGRDIIMLTQEHSSTVSYDLDIMNNTFVLGGGSGTIIDIDFEPFNMLVPPVHVVNNIFVNEAVTPTSTQSAFCANRQVATANYNLYDNFNAIPCAAAGTSLMAGAESFTAAAGTDADLRLLIGSAAIDAGTGVNTPTVDFEGDVRPTGLAHDIGADEL